MVSDRLGLRDIFIGHPDMPRPQHRPRMVFHGNDRIALPDFRTADIKCDISIFSTSTIADVSQQIRPILPDEFRFYSCTAFVVIDVRIGNRIPKVVNESLQDMVVR